ncbi:glutathione S-transferase GstA [Daldinia caldariorum]|uniref:glutathione S-transferase GstA n=1 Tax=Daldinia caldariorum TaxID=326644 RepID=UPI0020085342|nr:glutathione S-transferase GstA [Daldinia caldariorum]KAI1470506.1 glutathione S-transferase GstA [Daldinia caldariorum]
MVTFPPEKAPKPGLNIYGFASVKPYKLAIAAEELDVPYNYVHVDMGADEHQSEWYTSINPNGRVPALVHVKEDGTSVSVFESGACLLYIAAEFDKEYKISYPFGTPEYWKQVSWASTVSNRPCRHEASISPFVGGDRLTIADIAIFIFAYSARWCGVNIDEFSNVKAWCDKLLQRPGFQRGLEVPKPYAFHDEAVSNSDAQEFYIRMRKLGSRAIKAATDKWHGDMVPVPSDHANY